jgi:hypothetical protein
VAGRRAGRERSRLVGLRRPTVILVALAASLVVVSLATTGCAPGAGRAVAATGSDPAYVLHDLPGWSPFAGFTLGRHVFLTREQQTAVSVGHELVHVRQQAASPIWFWWSYLASPGWRLRWEAEAYAVHARAGCPVDGDHGLAAYLSGPAYLWMASPAEASRAIRSYVR